MKNIFAVYKPLGMTSHDVVHYVRKITGEQRVGHGGTLDPLATGVLIIAVGRENTKKLNEYVAGEKEYVATIKLGEVSATDDSEGPIMSYIIPSRMGMTINAERNSESFLDSRFHGNDKDKEMDKLSNGKINDKWKMINGKFSPSRDDIESAIQNFIGLFPQMPPKFSAKKIHGKPAYKLARANKPVKLTPKMVEIMSIKIIRYKYPALTIRVTCGSGVYIRSLARDIGEKLKTGAYLQALERTRVGPPAGGFTAKNAITFEKLG